MLSRLALRGALVALLIGGATALAGIALMARTGLPGAAGLRAALVAAGGYLVVFTTARYQAALVVAANAVLDHRAITRRRALAMAGGRWKDLMIWSVVTVAPEPLRQIVSQADTPSSRLTSPAPAGSERREPAPLTSLLALPVIALETADVHVALNRLRENIFTQDARIRVEVDHRVVVLGGEVDSPIAKRVAGDDAWDTPGIVDVSNQLVVSGAS